MEREKEIRRIIDRINECSECFYYSDVFYKDGDKTKVVSSIDNLNRLLTALSELERIVLEEGK